MVDLVLFPSSYFSIKQVDEDLRKEYDAVKATGFFDTVLFGYDKWMNEEFLDLKFYEGHPNEYRVFYACNEIVTVSRNSGQQDYTPEPPKELIERYSNLPSCYYTVDFAELDDGTWNVMETGDGSVSGLSENQNAEHYFRTLYYALNKTNHEMRIGKENTQ